MALFGGDLSVVHLVLQASWFVKGVMLLLLLMSIVSWGVVLTKMWSLRQTRRCINRFERRFWSGIDLVALYRSISKDKHKASTVELIFEAGFCEFVKQHKLEEVDTNVARTLPSSVQRAMEAVQQRELSELERGLSGLASIGSVSPYIGLLGTVWGILVTFLSLGTGGAQLSLSQVAPGIAEALIATACGLLVAIPAVVAYNRLVDGFDRIAIRLDSFMREFVNVLLRQKKSS